MRIGYYVHHHGRGHATRAGVIGAELTRRGHAVTYLGSGALPDGDQVALTHDADETDAPFVDADAGGRLHWAPLGGGYEKRSTQIAGWVATARPDVVVVDVSVEVTALVRLLGVPVVVVGQPGRRNDAPHTLAFDLAAAVLAPWPAGLDVAPHLEAHRAKVVEVGGLSRFAAGATRSAWPESADGAPIRAPGRTGFPSGGGDGALSPRGIPGTIGVILVGGEGWDDPGLPDALRRAVPEIAWRTPSDELPVESLLATADVVVTHAGQNAIADVATFGVPPVVVPQARPFDEQADMARALDDAGIARSVPLGASTDAVADAVRALLAGDGARSTGAAWERWDVAGAPGRAADVIEGVARGVAGRNGSVDRGVAVVTPVRGRFEHLVNQRRFVDEVAPAVSHVIVAVDMPELADDLRARGVMGEHVTIVPIDDDPCGMPTARARNVGAAAALEAGAELLVFLDVDCAPLPGFVEALLAARDELDAVGERAVLNGIVTYLAEDARLDDESPEAARRFVAPHPVRPSPEVGEVEVNDDHRLLWSLAVALDADAWRACGGFDEAYVGYGGEDTDFGLRARDAGLRMAWVGGAHAVHQWHPSASPPRHHVVDIVRNANLYRERWGTWPMEGWLRAFADEGLVEWTDDSLVLGSALRAE